MISSVCWITTGVASFAHMETGEALDDRAGGFVGSFHLVADGAMGEEGGVPTFACESQFQQKSITQKASQHFPQALL